MRRRTAMAAALAAILASCSGQGASSPEGDLPAWEGELKNLFDDRINPAAVGLSMDGRSPAREPLLRARAQQADVVARMQLKSIIRALVGAKTTFALTLLVWTPTLMPAKLEDASFELSVRQGDDAFGMLDSVEPKLSAKPSDQMFVGFIKKFQGEEGPQIHWHLTADTQEVVQVIQEMAVLDEVAEQEK